MPPRISQTATRRLELRRLASRPTDISQCLLCSFSSFAGPATTSRRPTPKAQAPRHSSVRGQATVSSAIAQQASPISSNPRAELKQALVDLQKNSRQYVNLSRLQLALRGLDQQPGEETIRIAVLGLGDQQQTAAKARELVRLLIADPLREEEEWERILLQNAAEGSPVLLKIGQEQLEDAVHMTSGRLIKELHVCSPTLNSHKLEILVLQTDALVGAAREQDGFADGLLVPSVEIPTSRTGRYTPMTTPVHKAIVVGDGIYGAASLLQLGSTSDKTTVAVTVDLPGLQDESLPLQVINVAQASAALASFRESVSNAVSYERGWFQSGLPAVLDWVKAGSTGISGAQALKAPVSSLIGSIITESNNRVAEIESQQLATLLATHTSTATLVGLRSEFSGWSNRAHTELRDSLESAFSGGRWRKLGWWKLFWRVDDVSYLSSSILTRNFLTESEKELIHLTGMIEQAGVLRNIHTTGFQEDWAYKEEVEKVSVKALGTLAPTPKWSELVEKPKGEEDLRTIKPQPWPLHIPVTRAHLLVDSVPALQALAQKLVLQTLSTSGFASIFSGLIYIADSTTSVYEAGAVAALGIVWSLRRLQKKWETARECWERDVSEDGRMAIRSVESVVDDVLKDPKKVEIDGRAELDRARRAIERVDRALQRLINSQKQ